MELPGSPGPWLPVARGGGDGRLGEANVSSTGAGRGCECDGRAGGGTIPAQDAIFGTLWTLQPQFDISTVFVLP